MKHPPATRRDRGATIPIVALLLPVLILMVAFAVDLGRQRSDRRSMQATADVVALDMARVIGGRTVSVVSTDPATLDALQASAARNGAVADLFAAAVGGPDPRVTGLEWGTLTAGGNDFQPLNPSTQGTVVPTAVRVTTEDTTDYFFRSGSGHVTRAAVAAMAEPDVDLTVGSVAAGFQPSIPNSVGLDAQVRALNARLAAQFGATVPNPGTAGFDLVGYRGLAAADVDLDRVAANAGFASADELMNSNITTGQFFSATAAALDQQAAAGDPNAASAATQLRRFQTQMGVNNNATMQLGNTLQANAGGASAAGASVKVLDLLSGSGNVINGTNLISYQFNPGIPGVAIANVQQHLVQKATFAPNRRIGDSAKNTQARFQINLQVAPLLGMTQALQIPLVVEAAIATGTVMDLVCNSPLVDSDALIRAVTSGLTVRLGTATDLTTPNSLVVNGGVIIQGGGLNVSALLSLGLSLGQILGLNLTQTTSATASASLLGGTSDMLFHPFAVPNPYQRAPGGVGGATLGAQLSSSLTARLGNGLLPAAFNTNLRNQLGYVFNNLDALILNPLLAAAGVTIAGADLLAEDLDCEGAGLKLVG